MASKKSGKQTEKKSNSNKLDLYNLSRDSIKKIDVEDPAILDQFGLYAVPNYDDLEPADALKRYKAAFFKVIIIGAICENQRDRIFAKFKDVAAEIGEGNLDEFDDADNPENKDDKEDNEDNEDNEDKEDNEDNEDN